jgi:hypothetical protein
MPRVVITHAVSDVEAWASYRAERAGFFAKFATDVVDYLPTDVHDMDGLQAALATPEAIALEEHHGVIPPISTFVESR